MKKRFLILAVFALVGLLVMAGCSSKNEPSKQESSGQTTGDTRTSSDTEVKKLNVGYLPTPGHVLYFVGKEKGFFKEEGLDVELFQFTNSGEGLNAVKTGKIDIGAFGTAAPLTFIAKGAEFTIFGGQQSEGAGIITRPEAAEQFKDIKNFKGKKVATVRLATGDVVFRGALKEAGIDWKKDLEIQELDSPSAVLEAVKKGSVDAGVVWAPFMKLGEKQGLKIVKYSSELLKSHACCRQVALTANIQQNPEDYKKFLRGLIKAYDFYKTNKNETVEIIAKYVKIDKDIIEAETYGGHIFSDPNPDRSGVIKFWEFMNNAGYVSSDINIDDHINTDLYKEALAEVVKEEPDNANFKSHQAE